MSLVRSRLSLMMFLQFFIWGAWFVTMGTFMASNLNASGEQTGLAFATQSWGAIIAPFVIGLIADRYFAAEKILGLLHLAGAILLFAAFRSSDFTTFYPLIFAYMLAYMPTLALVNAISFRQMQEPSAEFPAVRMWGTIGWIVAGLAISYLFHWDSAEGIAAGRLQNTFALAAGASLLLGVYAFTLPATPPLGSGESSGLRTLLGADALALLKERNFAVFFICAILICIPLAFYYQNANLFLAEAGVANPTGKMTIGQVSEALFILLLPYFIRRFGFKGTLLAGMAAWSIRYGLFAYGDAGERLYMLLLGIALHGICYDFFFVAGQIYTDRRAAPEHRSSAQGLLTLATYGLGMLVGFSIAGLVSDHYTSDGLRDWSAIWLVPAGFAAAVLVAFLLAFRDNTGTDASSNVPERA